MNSKEIREAFERVLEDVQNMANDGLICNVMDDIIYIKARKALAALSTIDSDAIKRECAKKARNAILSFGKGDTVSSRYSPMIRKEMAAELAEIAILGAEPAQDDVWHCTKEDAEKRAASFQSKKPAHDDGKVEVGDIIGWNDHDGMNIDIITGSPFSPIHYLKPRGIKPIVLMRAAEVRRRIEEASK